MRPITNFALHAFAAAVLTAFAATSAAAQYLALGDSIPAGSAAKGKEKWIEIQGWDWGAAAKIDAFTVKQGVKPVAKGGNVEFEWKVEEGESAPPAPGGVRVASGDVDGDPVLSEVEGGRAAVKPRTPRSTGWYRQKPVVTVRDADAGTPTGGTAIGKAIGNAATDGDEASGQATGKRQHMPIRARTYYDQNAVPAEKRQHGWVTVSKPLDRGSVRVKVKTPWLGCAVGARYPVITLGDGANSQRLQDVTVASCGGTAEAPEESITFVYGKLGAKVGVRGWDPEKKEQ